MSVEILIRADTFQEEQSSSYLTRDGVVGPILFADPYNRQHIHSHHSTPNHHQRPPPPPSSIVPTSSSPHLINEVDIDDEDEQIWKKSRCNLISNLFILGVACMAMQTAFFINNSVSNDDDNKLINYHHMSKKWSSVNPIVYWSVFVLEKFIKIFDCLILPQYLIKKIGCKSTIFVSFLSYLIFYLTTRFYPLTYASYLGVFLNEILGNSFWVASLVYLTDLAYLFIKITLLSKEFIICLFYSTFYGLVYTSFTWNALVRTNSSNVYSMSQALTSASNRSITTTRTTPTLAAANQNQESDKMLNFTIVLLSVFGALLTLLFLKKSNEKKIAMKLCNLKQAQNAYQWFMVPITFYLGMFQAFSFEFINEKLNNSILWDGYNIPIMVYTTSILLTCFLVPLMRKLISFNFLMILAILVNNLTVLAILLIKPEFSIALRLTLPILLGISITSLEIILTCYYALLFRGNEVTSFSFYILIKTFGILTILAIDVSVLVECLVFIVISAIGLVLHFVIIFFN